MIGQDVVHKGKQDFCPHCDVGFGYYGAAPGVTFVKTGTVSEVVVYECPNCGEPFHNAERRPKPLHE